MLGNFDPVWCHIHGKGLGSLPVQKWGEDVGSLGVPDDEFWWQIYEAWVHQGSQKSGYGCLSTG